MTINRLSIIGAVRIMMIHRGLSVQDVQDWLIIMSFNTVSIYRLRFGLDNGPKQNEPIPYTGPRFGYIGFGIGMSMTLESGWS